MKVLISLLDLTILIPVRLDTISRLENILGTTQFLATNLDTKIWVMESAKCKNGFLEKLLDNNIQYSFWEDHDPILYRTKFLNQMTKYVATPFLAVWDADVITPIIQIIKAMELLRTGEADFVYPYEFQFLDTSPILKNLFLQERKIEILEQNAKKMKEMYLPNPVGGAFLANFRAYNEAGLENENFYGWGMEDGERFYRWEKMGYKIKRVSGPLFHLSHDRGINSTYHNVDQKIFKRKEVINVRRKISVNSFQSNDETT